MEKTEEISDRTAVIILDEIAKQRPLSQDGIQELDPEKANVLLDPSLFSRYCKYDDNPECLAILEDSYSGRRQELALKLLEFFLEQSTKITRGGLKGFVFSCIFNGWSQSRPVNLKTGLFFSRPEDSSRFDGVLSVSWTENALVDSQDILNILGPEEKLWSYREDIFGLGNPTKTTTVSGDGDQSCDEIHAIDPVTS